MSGSALDQERIEALRAWGLLREYRVTLECVKCGFSETFLCAEGWMPPTGGPGLHCPRCRPTEAMPSAK